MYGKSPKYEKIAQNITIERSNAHSVPGSGSQENGIAVERFLPVFMVPVNLSYCQVLACKKKYLCIVQFA